MKLESLHILYPAFEACYMIDDLKSLIEEQIQPWMKSCCEQEGSHGRCGPANDSIALPTRLVDVGTSQHPLIKLVETDQRETHGTCPYFILSYCWGQGNSSAKTTSDNLMKRLQEISVDELPKTIQDAILVTRMMGYQYIWIDAMCIVQATDENDTGDFTSEAPKMGDYYANADCCISASLASDSSEGFLTQRPLARFPIIQDLILKFSDSPSTPSYSSFFGAHQSPYDLMKNLIDTPLMQRGWYLQELMLSRRILHWTVHGLYLQCQSCICLEGNLGLWPCSSSDVFPCGFDADVFDPREVLALPNDRILAFDGWYRLLEVFSQRKLTFESDRMYAIHGIACVLVQRFGAEYFYGLFRRHLAQGLAWARGSYRNHDSPRVLNRPLKPSRRTEYPTWCWASDCPVEFDPIDEKHVFVHDNHPRRPRLFPTHSRNMTLRAGLDSRLYIKAPLIHVSLGSGTACIRHNRNDRRMEGFYFCVLDTQLEGIDGSLAPRSPLYDPTLALGDQGVDVQWLLLGLDARDEVVSNVVGERWYVGLLVYEVEGQGVGLYRRYARLNILWEGGKSIKDFSDELEEVILE